MLPLPADPYIFERLQNLHAVRAKQRGSRYATGTEPIDVPNIMWSAPTKLAGGCHLSEGSFMSPAYNDGTLPVQSHTAKLHIITPHQVEVGPAGPVGGGGPVWLWLAGTGEVPRPSLQSTLRHHIHKATTTDFLP